MKKRSKANRSFWGAFLGAFSALWPAATWNLPWLLLSGGITGWLVGYHGDRIWAGISFTWRKIHALALLSKANRAIRYCKGLLGQCLVFLTKIPGAVLRLFTGLVRETLKSVPAAIHWAKTIPKTKFIPDMQNPFDEGRAVRKEIMVIYSWAMLIAATIFIAWMDKGTYSGFSGKAEIVGSSISFGFIVLIICVFPMLVVYGGETKTQKGIFALWDRYEESSRWGFVLKEIGRLLCLQVWWILFGPIFIVCIIVVGICSVALLAPLAVILYYPLLFACHMAHLDGDYGIPSLTIALLAGAATFYSYRPELVSDPIYRLAVSFIVAAGAGAVSYCSIRLSPFLMKNIKRFSAKTGIDPDFGVYFGSFAAITGGAAIALWWLGKKLMLVHSDPVADLA